MSFSSPLGQHGVGLDHVVLQHGAAEAAHPHRRGRPRGRGEVARGEVAEVLKRTMKGQCQPSHLNKFQILITSYEVFMLDFQTVILDIPFQ